MKRIVLFMIFSVFLNAESSYYEKGKLVQLKKLYEKRISDNNNIEYYQTQGGYRIGIKDEILVQCKEGINCSKLLASYSNVEVLKLTDKIFVLKVQDYDTVFSTSRELFNSGSVDYAHPNFIKERKLR